MLTRWLTDGDITIRMQAVMMTVQTGQMPGLRYNEPLMVLTGHSLQRDTAVLNNSGAGAATLSVSGF